MFSNWAQPVVSRKWAVVCVVLSTLKRASGYRFFVSSSHRAWELACDVDHLTLS